MKKKIIKLIVACFLISTGAMAQNGISLHTFPAGYTYQQLRLNNEIYSDAQNHIWVAFRAVGLGKFDGTSWTFFNTANSGIPSDSVFSVTSDNLNNMWVATKMGLAKFDGVTWTVYDSLNSGLPATAYRVKAIGNIIWCGTMLGAATFDGTNWSVYNTQNSGIAGDSVTAFEAGNNGEVYIGTKSSGFSVFFNNIWTNYDSSNTTLTGDAIKKMVVDGNNDAWILNTAHQLYKLSGNLLFNFATELYNGVITLNFNFGMTKNAAGNIVFPFPHYLGNFSIGEITGNEVSTIVFSGLSFVPGGAINASCAMDGNDVLWLSGIVYDINSNPAIASLDKSQIIPIPFAITNQNTKYIDINGVKAAILNRGDMHWNLLEGQYEVPKGSGTHAVYTSALWMGGLDGNGQLHAAAQTYRQTGVDFWPGPVDTLSGLADSATNIQYDRIWKIDRNLLAEFITNFNNGSVTNGTYPVPEPITTWPAQGSGNITRDLAPFVDLNNDGAYNPMDGDYPMIKGDQMLYWIINDNLAIHSETGSPPLGVEIHCSAYAYTCDQLPDSETVMQYSTFYQYKIINRSAVNYTDFYIGLWCDNDLGDAINNFVGCDTLLDAGFVYSGDPDSLGGYGLNPPMQNIKVLQGPVADVGDGLDNDHDGIMDEVGETCLMNGFMKYNNVNNTPTGNPNGGPDYYNYLKSVWLDNIPLTYGQDGRNPGFPVTKFMYSGAPYDVNGWSELTAGNQPEDRRLLISSGPVTLASGGEKTIDFAYVYTRDTTGPNGLTTSIARNKTDLQRVQNWFDNNNFPSCLIVNPTVGEIQNDFNITIHPNPSHDFIYVGIQNSVSKNATYEIMDITARVVKSGLLNKGAITISQLTNGIYSLRIMDGTQSSSRKFIKQ